MSILKTTFAAASVAFFAVAANASTVTTPIAAITVSNGDYDSESYKLAPGHAVTYTFTATENLILSVAYAVTGALPDLENVSYGTFEHENFFTNYGATGNVFGATASAQYTLQAGQSLVLGFFDGVQKSVGTSLSYSAMAIPAVPVPAAGFLLLGGLAAFGAVKRRKN